MTRYFVLFTALLFIAACDGGNGEPADIDTAPDDQPDVETTDDQSDQTDQSDQSDPTDQSDSSDPSYESDELTDTDFPDDTIDDALIADADTVIECIDGTIDDGDCGYPNGKQIRDCVDGKWGEWSECLDINKAVIDITAASTCADYYWADRGDAPLAYTTGMGLVFAGAFCHLDRSDVATVAAAKTADTEHDALAWYEEIFADLSMDNSVDGADTLRHAYTLLIGLGMRESSGEHCCGRDQSADNVTADTAEAGLFQTSYNSHNFSDELDTLYAHWKILYNMAFPVACLLDIFSEDVYCSAADWENYGTGEGVIFQEMEKSCPAFAAEYAAFMLRVSGGSLGHYGPLRRHEAEVRPECDAMFGEIQALIEANPYYCRFLPNY